MYLCQGGNCIFMDAIIIPKDLILLISTNIENYLQILIISEAEN